MDGITQIQSYLRTLASTYSSTLQFIHDASPPSAASSSPTSAEELVHAQALVEKSEQVFRLLLEGRFIRLFKCERFVY